MKTSTLLQVCRSNVCFQSKCFCAVTIKRRKKKRLLLFQEEENLISRTSWWTRDSRVTTSVQFPPQFITKENFPTLWPRLSNQNAGSPFKVNRSHDHVRYNQQSVSIICRIILFYWYVRKNTSSYRQNCLATFVFVFFQNVAVLIHGFLFEQLSFWDGNAAGDTEGFIHWGVTSVHTWPGKPGETNNVPSQVILGTLWRQSY